MAEPVGSHCQLRLLWLVGLAFPVIDSPDFTLQLLERSAFGTLRGTSAEAAHGKCN